MCFYNSTIRNLNVNCDKINGQPCPLIANFTRTEGFEKLQIDFVALNIYLDNTEPKLLDVLNRESISYWEAGTHLLWIAFSFARKLKGEIGISRKVLTKQISLWRVRTVRVGKKRHGIGIKEMRHRTIALVDNARIVNL